MTGFWLGVAVGALAGFRVCWWWLPWALARAEVETKAERMRKLVRRR